MHILSVFRTDHPLVRALAEAGHEIVVVGELDLPSGEQLSNASFYLGDIFPQIKAPFILARLKGLLSAHGIPYIVWNRDSPWNCAIKPWRKLMIRPLRAIDIYLAHSLQDQKCFARDAEYFPNAADTHLYHLGSRSLISLRDRQSYKTDVTFVGTLSPGFRRVRKRVEFLVALAGRFKALGISWQFLDTSVGTAARTTAENIEFVQQSRINLSVGAVCDYPEKSWGLPERCFGIAAAGGFLACDDRKHAAQTLPANSWAGFASIDECVEKIRFHLAQFDLSRDMAESLHSHVIQNHTYVARATQLVEIVQSWKLRAVS